MAVVFAAPFIPPVPPRSWIGLDMSWTGWDGSVWSLTSASDGAVLMPGVRGLTMPPVTHYSTSYASVAGARWRGHNIESREVFWPLQIFADNSSQDWIDRDRAFWRTMRPDKTGTWTVTQPDGSSRSLTCRFVDDGQQAFNTDPVAVGWTNYGITLRADSPFWRGTDVRREWTAAAPTGKFHQTTPGNGVVKIAGTSVTNPSSTTLSNPGDVDTYPIWEVIGPVDFATVGVGTRTITIPFAVAAGKVLIINTAPTSQTATLYNYTGTGTSRVLSGAVDKTMSLTNVDFAPVRAESATSFTVGGQGAGRLSMTLTPLYLRAW